MGFYNTAEEGFCLRLRIGEWTDQTFAITGSESEVCEIIQSANPFVNMMRRYDFLVERGNLAPEERDTRCRVCARIILQKMWSRRRN